MLKVSQSAQEAGSLDQAQSEKRNRRRRVPWQDPRGRACSLQSQILQYLVDKANELIVADKRLTSCDGQERFDRPVGAVVGRIDDSRKTRIDHIEGTLSIARVDCGQTGRCKFLRS